MSKLMLKKATVLAVLEALKAAQTEIKTQETSKVAAARSEAKIQTLAKVAGPMLVERGLLSKEKVAGWQANVCGPEGHQVALESLNEVVKMAAAKNPVLGKVKSEKRAGEAPLRYSGDTRTPSQADQVFLDKIGL